MYYFRKINKGPNSHIIGMSFRFRDELCRVLRPDVDVHETVAGRLPHEHVEGEGRDAETLHPGHVDEDAAARRIRTEHDPGSAPVPPGEGCEEGPVQGDGRVTARQVGLLEAEGEPHGLGDRLSGRLGQRVEDGVLSAVSHGSEVAHVVGQMRGKVAVGDLTIDVGGAIVAVEVCPRFMDARPIG